MSLDERTRHDLYTAFEQLWNRERAEAMMSAFSTVEWDDLATRQDLDVLGAALRTEMADLRTELRTDMAELRTELRTDMADLRTELRTGLADVRTEFHRDLVASTRTMVFSLTSSVFVVGSLAFAAATLV